MRLAELRSSGDLTARRFAALEERSFQLPLALSAAHVLAERWRKVPERKRPHYLPEQRFEILRVKAALVLTAGETARLFAISAGTVHRWEAELREAQAIDRDVSSIGCKIEAVPPVRRYADVVRALVLSLAAQLAFGSALESRPNRTISGVIVGPKNEVLNGVTILLRSKSGEQRTTTNERGQFSVEAPTGEITLHVEGQYITPQDRMISASEQPANLRIEIEYLIPPIHQSLVITASALEPQVETRSDEVYKKTLISRDDQLLETLNAGINAGQHEGGGKSLEIRRFGFNLDHGGVNGGLKILVDDIQQNQGTQGHGQGYLGALKTLTPELIQDVNILNGPFSAEYGDFSGLGVVHIRLRESLPDQFTARLQGGSFGSYRTFFGYSPSLEMGDAFLAYEGSRTEGPFLNPLRYKRDNVTANFTKHLTDRESLGFKINFGRNDFFSSGQIPLDLVATGELPRYGFIDSNDGGRVRMGTLGLYYQRNLARGDTLKLDGFVSRSLFDLYSNFTFFLNDPVHGDGIQQHYSRHQEGANSQYLHPYRLWGNQALLTAGTNFHDNQINVGLYPQQRRVPIDVTTRAFAHVANTGGYVQHHQWMGQVPELDQGDEQRRYACDDCAQEGNHREKHGHETDQHGIRQSYDKKP